MRIFFNYSFLIYDLYESHERIFEEDVYFYFYCLYCQQFLFAFVSVPKGFPKLTLILAQKSIVVYTRCFYFI